MASPQHKREIHNNMISEYIKTKKIRSRKFLSFWQSFSNKVTYSEIQSIQSYTINHTATASIWFLRMAKRNAYRQHCPQVQRGWGVHFICCDWGAIVCAFCDTNKWGQTDPHYGRQPSSLSVRRAESARSARAVTEPCCLLQLSQSFWWQKGTPGMSGLRAENLRVGGWGTACDEGRRSVRE